VRHNADEPEFLYAAAYEGRNYDAIEVMEVSKVLANVFCAKRQIRPCPSSTVPADANHPMPTLAIPHAAGGSTKPL
jgi:hypothetical protein